MSTVTLSNVRIMSDVRLQVKLKDSGVAVDWSDVTIKSLCMYSEKQKTFAGSCTYTVDSDDPTILHALYPAEEQYYLGKYRLIVSIEYQDDRVTYDAEAFTMVGLTEEVEDETITVEEISVGVEVTSLDTSVLTSILTACQQATDDATTAKNSANTAAANAVAATSAANTAKTNANNAATNANTKATLADQKATLADQKATLANEKASYAETQGNYAKTQGDYAKAQGDYAKTQGNAAKASKESADAATALANTAASSATSAASSANNAASAANSAATNANTKLAELSTYATQVSGISPYKVQITDEEGENVALTAYCDGEDMHLCLSSDSLGTTSAYIDNVITPVEDSQASNKGYVDSKVSNVVNNRVAPLERKTSGISKNADGDTLIDGINFTDFEDSTSENLGAVMVRTTKISYANNNTTIDGVLSVNSDIRCNAVGGRENNSHYVEFTNSLSTFFDADGNPSDVQVKDIYYGDGTKKLSELAQKINEIINDSSSGTSVEVIDNLTSTSTTSALSANQGKQLKTLLDAKGTYSKPSGGIPKTDLSSAVQASLSKADTALQSVPSTYRTSSAQDTIDSGKADKIIKVSSIPADGFVPNVLYKLGSITGAVTFTIASYSIDYAEYMIEFETGDTAPTITWFTGVTWLGGTAPVVSANKKYYVSVLDNLAVIGEF